VGGLLVGGLPMGGLPVGGLPVGGLPVGGLLVGGLPVGGLPGLGSVLLSLVQCSDTVRWMTGMAQVDVTAEEMVIAVCRDCV